VEHVTSSERPVETGSAFERLSRLRLKDHSVESALREVAELAKNTVPGASEVSVSLVSKQRSDTVVHTGDLALDLDENQYERGYGPCLDAANDGMIMHIEDMATETRWGDYTKTAVERGALSSLSLPVTVREERRVTAALNIYSTSAHAFDSDALRTAASLAGYAETLLANMHEHDSSRQLVQQLAQAPRTRPSNCWSPPRSGRTANCATSPETSSTPSLSRGESPSSRSSALAL
jgi:GAF domain-containing protein